MMRSVLALTLGVLSLTACGGGDAEEQAVEPADVAEDANDLAGDVVYVVTSRDLRKCAYPMCGGFFVKAVNKNQTTCFDGTQKAECYVAAIDDSALGLSGSQRDEFRAGLEAGEHIAAGKLTAVPSHPGIAKLALTKGYEDTSANVAAGAYFLASSSGIVCITTPCPTIATVRLNTGTKRLATGVDFTALGVPDEVAEKALQQLFESSLIVSGKIVEKGAETILVASDFFTTVEPKASGPELCLTSPSCGPGKICDRSVCHSNCLPGMACPAICYGECVTPVAPPKLCLSNQACGPGQACDFSVCHSNCPPGMGCPAICWGACGPKN